MSAEPGHKKPYSTDIRLRVVYQRIGMSHTFQEIAKNLNVAVSTVYRIYKQFEVSGDIATPTNARKPRSDLRVLGEHSELEPNLVLARDLPNDSRSYISICITSHYLQVASSLWFY